MQKVGVDNRNPVKTSNINKPGATPQIFVWQQNQKIDP